MLYKIRDLLVTESLKGQYLMEAPGLDEPEVITEVLETEDTVIFYTDSGACYECECNEEVIITPEL